MSQEIITILELELKSIDTEIKRLVEQSEALNEVINVYEKYIPKKEVLNKKESIPKKVLKKSAPEKKKYYTPKPKITPEGKQKFAHYLLEIFQSEPDKIFHSAQLCDLMNDGIQSGKVVMPSKKDMSSAVGAYLWNFTQRGLLIKTEKSDTDRSSGYQLSGSAGKIKKHKKSSENISGLDSLDMFDETIINAVVKGVSINLESICHNIRLSQNFLEISKDISGSLLSCVEERISNLCRKNIIITAGDYYSVNPKYKYI